MRYGWNDFGNAERVLAKFGDRIRWVRSERDGYFTVYDDTKWERHGADTTVKGFIVETLKYLVDDESLEYSDIVASGARESDRDQFIKWAKTQQSAAAINGCFRTLQGWPSILSWEGLFDQNRNMLNFRNGTMDTDTVWFGGHDPAEMITKILPVSYVPNAECPRWKSFLEESIKDKATREYFQRVVGYTLTGRSNEKVLMWLYGPANTGKSIVVNTFAKLFGQDYGVTANDNVLRPKRGGGASPEVNSMKGKRYVTTSETGHGATLDEALIKRLTGGDVQNSRGLYQNESNWSPECVIWVASNAFPQPHGDDDAIWGRFRPIEFTEVYGPDNPARDPRLAETLSGELEGIMAWAVEGLRMYLAEGLGPIPHAMAMTTAKFLEAADQVRRFLYEAEDAGKIRIAAGHQCERTPLHRMYQQWAEETGVGRLSAPRFYERLAGIEGIERVDKASNSKRYVVGIEMLAVLWHATPAYIGR